MPGQFILGAPPNGTGKLINRPRRIKRDHQFKVIPSLAQNPASLVSDMKTLDHFTRDGRHKERGLGPRTPIFLLGAGLPTPPVA